MLTKEKILNIMTKEDYKPLDAQKLLEVLGQEPENLKALQDLLNELEDSGDLVFTKKHKYGLPERLGAFSGIYNRTTTGNGFIKLPVNNGEVSINSYDGYRAMDGDEVLAYVTESASRKSKARGKIVKILKRAHREVVGTIIKEGKFLYLLPVKEKICDPIKITNEKKVRKYKNKLVIVRITDYSAHPFEGEIVKTLGDVNDVQNIIQGIIISSCIKESFPEELLKYVQNVPDSPCKADLEGRTDFRHLLTITIDGKDAKDFDDAISLQYLENDKRYRLGIHIADVSHYVKSKSLLDQEAFNRGTSVYLVDRVVPMLPKELSNGICSLKEGLDRLAVSVVIDYDFEGNIIDSSLCESIIRVNKRFTYSDVSQIIVDNDLHTKNAYSNYMEMLQSMKYLSEKLRKKRYTKGSINFDFDESEIIMDASGNPIAVEKARRDQANEIIEEFMLAANGIVAERLHWLEIPFLYRIHEKPDKERMSDLKHFLAALGYKVKKSKQYHPKTLQKVVEYFEGRPEEHLVYTAILRSLKLAKYSPNNKGHFGLATDIYTHFTSPIRRYPDLMVHRTLKQLLNNGTLENDDINHLNKTLPGIGKHCSEKERTAREGERQSKKVKMAEYMMGKIGDNYTGIISGVTSFGLFVQLDNTVEGLIKIHELDYDYYNYIPSKYCLVGKNSNKQYRIGDKIDITVLNASPAKGEIDFILQHN